MIKNHLHLVLYQPEIPQNTGNIGRLAAATQCRLHLIKPFGFSDSDKNLRRSGLDYWPYLDVEIHQHMDHFLKLFSSRRLAFFSKKAEKNYFDMPDHIDTLIFGQETSGLPNDLWQKFSDNFYKIPIYHEKVRSLNLANSVSIVTYHQLLSRKKRLQL